MEVQTELLEQFSNFGVFVYQYYQFFCRRQCVTAKHCAVSFLEYHFGVCVQACEILENSISCLHSYVTKLIKKLSLYNLNHVL